MKRALLEILAKTATVGIVVVMTAKLIGGLIAPDISPDQKSEAARQAQGLPVMQYAPIPDISPPRNPHENLQLKSFNWNRGGFDTSMIASFSIYNAGGTDLKDIEITCFHAGKSGTIIDKNVRTIYDVVKAGETKEVRDFNMGFINSQAAASKPEITSAKFVNQ